MYDVQEVFFSTIIHRWSKRGAATDNVGREWGFGDFSGVIQTHCTVRLSRLGNGVVARCGCIEKRGQLLGDISIRQSDDVVVFLVFVSVRLSGPSRVLGLFIKWTAQDWLTL